MNDKVECVFLKKWGIWALLLGLTCPGFLFAKTLEPVSWKSLKAMEISSQKESQVLVLEQAKLFVVDLWASWCGPCQESFPFLAEMQKQYLSKGLVVVGISLDSEFSDAQEFAQKNKVNYSLYFDQSHSLRERLSIPALPFIYFVNAKGEVLSEHRGFKKSSREEIKKEIIRLMGLQ